MRIMRKRVLFLVLASLASLGFPAAPFAQNTMVMPGPGWPVVRAEWGAGNRWMDVTNQVRMLLSGNGMVRVNNQNMGGDPAVGADKTLRISARDDRGRVQQFSFKEGSSIDASQFYNYGGVPGRPPGPPAESRLPRWARPPQTGDRTCVLRAE
jgi:hypothetical protein